MLKGSLLTKRHKDKQLFSNMITGILKFSFQPKVLQENIIVCVHACIKEKLLNVFTKMTVTCFLVYVFFLTQ